MSHMRRLRTVVVLGALVLGDAAAAQDAAPTSGSVDAVVAWEIDAACSRRPGSLAPAGLIERDLTGDGRADLVVDHAAIRCEDGTPSGYCRRDICTFRVYVRRDERLLASAIQRGRGLDISDAAELRWTDRSGEPRSMRWNGRRFD